jgi:inner membrane protein
MRANVLLKAMVVGVLALAFVVPLVMIWGVVKDRSRYRDTVTAEVARSTAQSQTLVGPLVVVRYRERIPAAGKSDVEQVRDGVDLILPDSLSIRSKAHVETRQRGIHRVPVFRATAGLTAAFTLPPRLGVSDKRQLVEDSGWKSCLSLGSAGIRSVPEVKLDGATSRGRPRRPGLAQERVHRGASSGAAGRRVPLEVISI